MTSSCDNSPQPSGGGAWYSKVVRQGVGPRAVAAGWVLAAVACAGCLPLGGPPPGRQELHARDIASVGFAQPAIGGKTPLYTGRFDLSGATPCASYGSVFAVDEPPGGDGLATERLLADHVDLQFPGVFPGDQAPSYGIVADARGRVVLARQPPVMPIVRSDGFQDCPLGGITFLRIAPDTGATTELGHPFYPFASSNFGIFDGRTRVVFEALVDLPMNVKQGTAIVDLDDHKVTYAAMSAQVIGRDVYATTQMNVFSRLERDGSITPLANDVGSFQALPSPRGFLVGLTPVYDGTPPTAGVRLFDPAAGAEVPLPPTTPLTQVQVSPSGRYIMLIEPGASFDNVAALTLVDRDGGSPETQRWRIDQTNLWRPGKDEFWNDEGATVHIWRPGAPPLDLPVEAGSSWFPPDGRTWLHGVGARVDARLADDPQAPAFALNPPDVRIDNVIPTPDGRLITQVKVGPNSRYDIYLVDVAARTRTPLAAGGFIVTAGATRALAMLEWVMTGSSGTLSLIDYDTGTITRLAENAYRFAVEPAAPGGDRLAPGLRLATLVRNRIASPYDGLWMTTLP